MRTLVGLRRFHHVAIAVSAVLASLAVTGGAAAQKPQIEGTWRSSNGSTIRVEVKGAEASGRFVDVGPDARALGFKPGDVSLTGMIVENYVHGVQTIRYGGTCHPNGRKVPFIARVTPNGQVLAIHFYTVQLDNSCRDTGQYSIDETLWQRVRGR